MAAAVRVAVAVAVVLAAAAVAISINSNFKFHSLDRGTVTARGERAGGREKKIEKEREAREREVVWLGEA